MAVRQSRGRYVVEFQQGGGRIFRRLPPGITKAQASEWETKLRRELFDRGPLGKREALSLPAALQLWTENTPRKNTKQAVSEAQQWAEYAEGQFLADAPEVARKAVSAWKLEKAKPSTINRRLAALKAAAKYAWKQDWHAENVSARISLLPERNARSVYLTKPEVGRIATHMPDDEHRSATWLLAYCGPRISELLGHPKLARGVTRLHFPARTTKNSKARVVPVPAAARQHLRAIPFGFDYQQFYDTFVVAKRKAKLGHVNIHDLRHTCASWLINEGVDLYTVAAILGDTLQQAQRYAHLADQTLERAMARLK